MNMDKLTQGEPGIPIRPPHPLQRQRKGVPMDTRYTNTSTEENFHISEMNLKMKDHYKETMQARRCGKEGFEKRHSMMQYQDAIPEGRHTRMLFPDDAITKGFTYKQAGIRTH